MRDLIIFTISIFPIILSFILFFNAFHSNKVIYNRMAYNLSCYKPFR